LHGFLLRKGEFTAVDFPNAAFTTGQFAVGGPVWSLLAARASFALFPSFNPFEGN
jgi:hypothetical protein